MTTHDTQTPEKLETLRTVAHAATGDPERYPCRERWSRYHHALQAAYEDGHLVVRPDAEPLASTPVGAQIGPDAGVNATAVSVKPLVDALTRIQHLARMVAHDLQGRVEGGKVAAVLQCAEVAGDALSALSPTQPDTVSQQEDGK